MKAWEVREKHEFYATVVFAETRGKAKYLALCTDCCEDSNFLNIEVRRAPQMDKYYKDGKVEMDWFNAQDRIALVKDCGFGVEMNLGGFPEDEFDEKYKKLIESTKISEILKAMGLENVVKEQDCKIITPEEFDMLYGDE